MVNHRKKRFAKPTSLKQKMWNYMRRNKTFRAGDMMMILDLKKDTARSYVYALASHGYLIDNNSKTVAFRDKIFILVKETGSLAPVPNRGGSLFYDPNLKKEIEKPKGVREQAWEYMLNNREFRISEIMVAITGMGLLAIQRLVRSLLDNGYLVKEDNRTRDPLYRLIKESEDLPVLTNGQPKGAINE